jgi:hypothetical protein
MSCEAHGVVLVDGVPAAPTIVTRHCGENGVVAVVALHMPGTTSDEAIEADEGA